MRYSNVKEAVENVMGGKILDHEAKDILNQGITRGLSRGIVALIETCQEVGLNKEEASQKLMQKFQISADEATEKVREYWKP